MLRILRSSSLSRSLTVALSSRSRTVSLAASLAARGDLTVAYRVRLILPARCTGKVRKAVGGDTVGGITGLMAGGGIAGTRAALPMPLGSLIEPFNPRAFAGPGGMPLTPASWAGDLAGAARTPNTVTASTAAWPTIHPRENIETGCVCFIGDPLPLVHFYPRAELGERSQSSHGPWSVSLPFSVHERTSPQISCAAAI